MIKNKKIIAFLLIFSFICFVPEFAAAAVTEDAGNTESSVSETEISDTGNVNELKKIVDFMPIKQQSFSVGTSKADVVSALPKQISGLDEQNNQVSLNNVTWTTTSFDSQKAGTYEFVASVDNPENQNVSIETEYPTVSVVLQKQNTIISGGSKTYKKKANKSISIKISVKNSGNRKLYLQRYSASEYRTVKSYKLSSNESNLTVKLPSNWYKPVKSKWRLYIPSDYKYNAQSKYFSTKAVRVFQNSKRYYQIKDSIPIRKSGYNLYRGMSGYKVYLVRKKFGLGGANLCSALYTNDLYRRVKRFQRKHRLKATGNVNLSTWRKLGYSKKSWYYTDSYVRPMRIDYRSTKKQCIKNFIKTALSYRGTKYIWCAAAKPKQGIDCAGLVIQALYSVGIDPLPVGSHVYAYPKNKYTTRRLWKSKKFKHVSFYRKKPGDIIYYYGHVSIYIGGGRMVEALPGGVRVSRVRGGAVGCLRPFV